MDVEIGDESSDESLRGNQQIDAALGTRPSAETAPASEPNAEQTASAGIPPTVPMPGTQNREWNVKPEIENELSGHPCGPEWPEHVHGGDCLVCNDQGRENVP